MEQIRAHTASQTTQMQRAPWKAMGTAFGAGAVFAAAIAAMRAFIISNTLR